MYVVTTDTYPGHWGRGDTEDEAIANCKRHHGRAPFISHQIHEYFASAFVDEFGQLWADIKPEYLHVPRKDRPAVVVQSVRIGARGKRTPLSKEA